MRKKNGFTLVELLAVIVILAIIMVIAIPSVLSSLNSSKRDAFHLYAQKIYNAAIETYTKGMDEHPDDITCNVYDITTDLGLTDTGNFDGWVKVERIKVSSGKRQATIKIPAQSKELQKVSFCVAKGTSCNPTESYFVEEGSKTATIKRALSEGQVFCVSYQVPDSSGVLKTTKMPCVKYSDSSTTEILDKYDYDIVLSLTNQTYSIENYPLNKDTSKEEISKAMDSFNESHNNLEISKPKCTGDTSVDDKKGTTTTSVTLVTSSTTTKLTTNITSSNGVTQNTTIVTKSSSTDRNTTYATSSTTSNNITYVTSNTSNGGPNGTTYVTGQTGNTQGTSYVTPSDRTTTTYGTTYVKAPDGKTEKITYITNNGTSEVSNEQSTTYVQVSEKTSASDELLLESLTVEGYDIEFSPGRYLYQIVVPNNVTTLNITATTKDPESTCSITGKTNFSVGDNVVMADVFSPKTGKHGYYRVIVKRFNENGQLPTKEKPTGSTQEWDPDSGKPDPNLDESNANLQSLVIAGYRIQFSPEILEYTISTNGEEKLNVTATPASKSATVIIKGNENIENDGKITVKVKSANGYYDKTYTIIVKFKKTESATTKTFRTVAIGLLAILAIIGIVLAMTKKNRLKARRDDESFEPPAKSEDDQQETNQSLPTTPGMAPQITNAQNQMQTTQQQNVPVEQNQTQMIPEQKADDNQVVDTNIQIEMPPVTNNQDPNQPAWQPTSQQPVHQAQVAQPTQQPIQPVQSAQQVQQTQVVPQAQMTQPTQQPIQPVQSVQQVQQTPVMPSQTQAIQPQQGMPIQQSNTVATQNNQGQTGQLPPQ